MLSALGKAMNWFAGPPLPQELLTPYPRLPPLPPVESVRCNPNPLKRPVNPRHLVRAQDRRNARMLWLGWRMEGQVKRASELCVRCMGVQPDLKLGKKRIVDETQALAEDTLGWRNEVDRAAKAPTPYAMAAYEQMADELVQRQNDQARWLNAARVEIEAEERRLQSALMASSSATGPGSDDTVAVPERLRTALWFLQEYTKIAADVWIRGVHIQRRPLDRAVRKAVKAATEQVKDIAVQAAAFRRSLTAFAQAPHPRYLAEYQQSAASAMRWRATTAPQVEAARRVIEAETRQWHYLGPIPDDDAYD